MPWQCRRRPGAALVCVSTGERYDRAILFGLLTAFNFVCPKRPEIAPALREFYATGSKTGTIVFSAKREA